MCLVDEGVLRQVVQSMMRGLLLEALLLDLGLALGWRMMQWWFLDQRLPV